MKTKPRPTVSEVTRLRDLNEKQHDRILELEDALRAARDALSMIRTPGAVALTTNHRNEAPYVRHVAEDAMLAAQAVLQDKA